MGSTVSLFAARSPASCFAAQSPSSRFLWHLAPRLGLRPLTSRLSLGAKEWGAPSLSLRLGLRPLARLSLRGSVSGLLLRGSVSILSLRGQSCPASTLRLKIGLDFF